MQLNPWFHANTLLDYAETSSLRKRLVATTPAPASTSGARTDPAGLTSDVSDPPSAPVFGRPGLIGFTVDDGLVGFTVEDGVGVTVADGVDVGDHLRGD